MSRMMLCLCIAACVSCGLASEAAPPADLAQEVLKYTGARTKIVWLHSLIGKGHGWDAISAEYELRGFDTAPAS
jgi:hypothetical protein